ncbi:AfsR/SARP family transcriptional regulator [Streptomyces sp. 8L]|uniref:AfsR/SARP family transcriptional regulator n=1 Tax=Streptomyces sp. 8L TaxID=2877242 RepID=UPI001CD29ACF|nr:bacterial transcriptional activator domain-containing protein [Streptomyces sp. 8L]MCA1221402.1 bacterial transcriptional activator domain-containing protein [Streptomyces sp. 8L]
MPCASSLPAPCRCPSRPTPPRSPRPQGRCAPGKPPRPATAARSPCTKAADEQSAEPAEPELAILSRAEAPASAFEQPATREAPAILVLGPVTIEGATGRIDSNRRSAGTELTAYLALHPGVDHHAVDDALWPGRLVNKNMRNAVISRTRSWLGKDPEGKPHLPRVQDTGDSRYRLGDEVTCDWSQFQQLARTGLAHHDDDGTRALRNALSLVRGRPFTGIDPQRYTWAEPDVQEMVSAIVDVAYELSTRAREAGDHTGALWAARRGLLAAEESELLHRQVFLAHYAAGDTNGLRAAAARLTRINEQLGGGVDMEAETAELLRTLLPQRPS